jgi:hypothetical protein
MNRIANRAAEKQMKYVRAVVSRHRPPASGSDEPQRTLRLLGHRFPGRWLFAGLIETCVWTGKGRFVRKHNGQEVVHGLGLFPECHEVHLDAPFEIEYLSRGPIPLEAIRIVEGRFVYSDCPWPDPLLNEATFQLNKCRRVSAHNTMFNEANHSPMTFDLSLSDLAGSRSPGRLVRPGRSNW